MCTCTACTPASQQFCTKRLQLYFPPTVLIRKEEVHVANDTSEKDGNFSDVVPSLDWTGKHHNGHTLASNTAPHPTGRGGTYIPLGFETVNQEKESQKGSCRKEMLEESMGLARSKVYRGQASLFLFRRETRLRS